MKLYTQYLGIQAFIEAETSRWLQNHFAFGVVARRAKLEGKQEVVATTFRFLANEKAGQTMGFELFHNFCFP